MAISNIEWQEWSEHPVTQQFLTDLRAARHEAMEAWAHENFSTEVENACALGGIRVLTDRIKFIEEGGQ